MTDRSNVAGRRKDLKQFFYDERKAGESTSRAIEMAIREATQIDLDEEVLDKFTSTYAETQDLRKALKAAFNMAGIGVRTNDQAGE